MPKNTTETAAESADEPAAQTPIVYATVENALAWHSPAPLEFDYLHPETEQWFRITGVSKAADKKAVYSEAFRLKEGEMQEAIQRAAGYTPTPTDLYDACWCAVCVTQPKMTALQWLVFGREASLDILSQQCLVASRMVTAMESGKEIPDGTEAAKAELKADPLG